MLMNLNLCLSGFNLRARFLVSRPGVCGDDRGPAGFQSPSEIFGEPALTILKVAAEKAQFQSPSEIFGEPAVLKAKARPKRICFNLRARFLVSRHSYSGLGLIC